MPTVIQYVVIFLIVLALFPFALVGLAQLPFLQLEVGGYLPSALYMVTTIIISILITLILMPILRKRVPTLIVFILGYACAFATYYTADLLIEDVTIPIYMELLFALFSNQSTKIKNEE